MKGFKNKVQKISCFKKLKNQMKQFKIEEQKILPCFQKSQTLIKLFKNKAQKFAMLSQAEKLHQTFQQ